MTAVQIPFEEAWPDDPAVRAEQAAQEVLRLAYQGHPAVVVNSPAGGGKTAIVNDLAAQSVGVFGHRACIGTFTNQQAADVTRRLLASYPKIPVTLYWRSGRPLPGDLRNHPRLRPATQVSDLPQGPSVVVSNVSKLGASTIPDGWFADLYLDESYQIAERLFAPVAPIAEYITQVGDPGQTRPVTTADITRWVDDPAGPHIAAPVALLARHPMVPVYRLPVSRRLTPDMVAVVRAAFYPDLPFCALIPPGARALDVARGGGAHVLDPVIQRALRGAGIVGVELPVADPILSDPELATTIVRLAERLIERGAVVVTPQGARPITPRDIGVVCAHREQVQAVQSRLPTALATIRTETTERWQGLESAVVIAWHPLAGPQRLTGFHLELGRACVMLTRATTATFIVGRANTSARLARLALESPRLGVVGHPAYEGLVAHRNLDAALREGGRMVSLTQSGSYRLGV